MTAIESETLLLYLQICADTYGESKPNNCDNVIDNNWQKLNLVIDGTVSGEYYYGFGAQNGFDAAIYYNSSTQEVIIGIRGTEPFANDGDVEESAKILNKISALSQPEVLSDFHSVIQNTLSSIQYTGTYKVVGHSLGGALATIYENNYSSSVSEVIAINTIGIGYIYPDSSKVTNYLAMNDIFAMYSYDEQIGAVKLVFPVSMRDFFNSIQFVISSNPLFSSFMQTFSNYFLNSLDPHNAVIFKENVAEYFSQNVLELDANKWSREKGLAIWYYDKDNIIVQNGFVNLGTFGCLCSIVPNRIDDLVNLLKSNINNIISYTQANQDTMNSVEYIKTIISDNLSYDDINDFVSTCNPLIEDIVSFIKNTDLTVLSDIANKLIDILNTAKDIIDDAYEKYQEDAAGLINNINTIINNIISTSTVDNLKDAIDTINEEIPETPRTLHYTTNNGDFILHSKENDIPIVDYLNFLKNPNNTRAKDDIVWGNGGSDFIFGGLGNDILIGDKSTYKVRELESLKNNLSQINEAKFENDEYSGNDVILGNQGDDLIFGGGGDDKLYGGRDNDYIYGGSGNDFLVSGSGADYVYGGEGRDILCNYEESARLYGEYGKDRYNLGEGTTNIIRDTDNKGEVYIKEYWLRGAEAQYYKGGNLWIKDNIKYLWNEDAEKLFIQKQGESEITTIEDYHYGALSIKLDKPKVEEIYADGQLQDPLVFDMNGDGIKTSISAYQGIYYDYNNDGFAEKMAWAADGDGVLVADINNDGVIQGSNEILTSLTLASYDTNLDGKIDYQDTNFQNLKIMDEDGNVFSLEDAGIASIDITNTEETNYTDENGNHCIKTGTYTTVDGETRQYGEYMMQTITENALELNKLEETQAVAELPDIENSGIVHSLHQAMLRDANLQTLVTSFTTETNDNVRMNLLEQIILKWTGAENVETDSRGDYINAQHLAVIEAFEGIDFYSEYDAQYGEEGTNPSNPNIEAAQLLSTKYEQLKIKIYGQLMKQTRLEAYYNAIDKTGIKYDLSPLITMLQTAITQNETAGKELVYQVAKMLKGLGITDFSNYFDPKDDSCFYTTFTKNDRELKWLIDTIGKVIFSGEAGEGEGSAADDAFKLGNAQSGYFHALSGDDVIYGSSGNDNFSACNGDDVVDGGSGDDVIDTHPGNDIVFGGAGNDIIHTAEGDDIIFGGDGDDTIYPDHSDNFSWAQDGDDIIRGGKGNDTIISMTGNDTFIFNLGDGQDTIVEKQGVDTLYFGSGISWDSLIFERVVDDMVIKIADTQDKITVKDWFVQNEDGLYVYNNNKIEIFEFADGSKHYKDEITVGDNTESVTYKMENYPGDIETAGGYKTTVKFRKGWNHIIAGADSDDTYILDKPSVDVCIEDFSGSDTIKFGEGITLARTFFAFNEDGLEVWFEQFDAHMQLQGNAENYKFEFSDGSVITDVSNLLRKDISYTDYIMKENLRELRLLGYESVTVTGNDHRNRIIGNYGNVTYDAGKGDDEIRSLGGGNDTYIFNIGDGNDNIIDAGGNDTIKFGEGITLENIRFLKDLDNNALQIVVEGYENTSVYIENFFGDEGNKIENFVFADGTVITDVEAHLKAYGAQGDIVLPDNIKEAELRGYGNTTATGNSLNNRLNGNMGDNTFIGGLGNDKYRDSKGGSERYYYNSGDGHDNIYDRGGIDAIIFGEGITKDNLKFSKDNEHGGLLIELLQQDGSIYIQDYFNDPEAKIEFLKFADGSVIDNIEQYIDDDSPDIQTSSSIVMGEEQTSAVLQGNSDAYVLGNKNNNTITGNAGNNTFHGGGGDDSFIDVSGGNEIYYYNAGHGHDYIKDIGGVDTIKFGREINPDNIRFEMKENNLYISFNEFEGSITIEGYFSDSEHKIENFEFEDGSILTDITGRLQAISTAESYVMPDETQIDTVYMTGNSSIGVVGNNESNVIFGNSGNNIMAGKGEDDNFIDTQGGDDIYIYHLGEGHDRIIDVGGTDTIKFGEGITLDNLVFIRNGNELNIHFDGVENSGIFIREFFSNPDCKIERFELSDGTVLTDISDYIKTIATDEDIVLPSNILNVDAKGENDISITGNASDNILAGNAGNNIITGGLGDDALRDDYDSNDTYIYNLGDGFDSLSDWGGFDTIKFGENIAPENLVFKFHNGDLLINFLNDEGGYIDGEIRIEEYFYDDNKRIERIQFADGTVIEDIDRRLSVIASDGDTENYYDVGVLELWGDADSKAVGRYRDELIHGNAGNNIIDPKGGNDTIIDTQGGNDTYIYNHDYNDKYIVDVGGNDTIKFGAGINVDDTSFIKEGNNLSIYFTENGNSRIQIENYFLNDENKIENFEFADDTVLTDTDINMIIQTMNSYGVEDDVVISGIENPNNEEILLAMAS